MDSNQALQQISQNLQKKYNLVNNLFIYTKEMEHLLNVSDLISFGATLKMRQDNMDLIDSITKDNNRLASLLPEKLREKMLIILSSNSKPVSLDNVLETNIYDKNKMILLLLKRVIALDDQVNKKADLIRKV